MEMYARACGVSGTALALAPGPCSGLQAVSQRLLCTRANAAPEVPPADYPGMLDWKGFHSPAGSH